MLDFCHTQKRQQHFENGIAEPRGLIGELLVLNSQVFMPLGNSGTIDQRQQLDKIDSELFYSSSLEAAVNLILGDPAFVSETATPSLKLLRAARFLKENAPHAFKIRKMGNEAKNGMDRWLWDLLDLKNKYVNSPPR